MNIRIIGNENSVYSYIKNDAIIYAIIMLLFVIGVFSGSLYFKMKNDESKSDTTSYIEESLSRINEVDSKDKFNKSLLKNIGIALMFWVLGASVIAIPLLYAYIVYKGFALGYTISSLLLTFGLIKGNIISFTSLFLHNIFSFSAILIAMTSSIKMLINLVLKKKDIKIELVRHTIICLFSLIFLVLSSICEIMTKGPLLDTIIGNIK